MQEKETAVVVAGGVGKRMGSSVPKQYLPLLGRPVLYYSLAAFQKSPVTDIVLVAAEGYLDYCKTEIVEKYGLSKVKKIVPGGKERFDSVYRGLLAAEGADYVYIHDGARPGLSLELVDTLRQQVREYQAVTAAVPVKSTIKAAGEDGFACATLDRDTLWDIQTPQAFSYPLIRGAYQKMMQAQHSDVTDDTMVAERFAGQRVKLCMGSYSNFKVTTPEDLVMMEALLASKTAQP